MRIPWADRSGSWGRSTAVPGAALAIDPALAQMNPCLVRDPGAAAAQHLHCLIEHQLPIGAFLVADEGDDCSLGLGDDLVGDHEHISRLRGEPGASQRCQQQRREVVTGGDLRNPG
jgi:hypothetical protein